MTTARPKAQPTLQIENDRVIVTEWRFPPGAETGWHQHGHDYIVIPGLDGDLLLETAEGESRSALKLGQSYFRTAGVKHNVINANDYEFAFVEVELK
ncbi:cupin domain-containing protein [Neptuniibacter halophilus]|uniref:cupin domain-containing protein n=1 Tax=Neptuniibacter halophilus TaxID=651666 RepID=UPI002573CC5D|nr:cupin domain-containing protein [Neptuniibacter halophilus]